MMNHESVRPIHFPYNFVYAKVRGEDPKNRLKSFMDEPLKEKEWLVGR